jgi:rhodanese-related sulfurtransferase
MTPTTQAEPHAETVRQASPEDVARWLDQGDAVLIDVREDFEHAEESIDNAIHTPLAAVDPETIRQAHAGRRIVFHCKAGPRSRDAASRLAAAGEPVYCLAGGIDAWRAAGLPVTRSANAPKLPVMRQVQIAAGSLVVIGVALGTLVSPWFLALSAFVGCGLVFAGVTGWCGMARLLGAMPWNRPPKAKSN